MTNDFTPGHTLVIPKAHVPHISDMSEEQSAALMHGIVRVTRARRKVCCGTTDWGAAFGATGLQVAANQEYAQVVNHVREIH